MKQRDPLHNKRVLVMGFGRQGRALARWLPTVGASVIVNDQCPAEQLQLDRSQFPGVEFVVGRHVEALAEEVDLVALSGGVPLDNPVVLKARERKLPLTNDAQLFLERCPAPVIGITGSAGKTTTTSLVGAMIQAAGYTTWVGGNIGDVLLDHLADIQPQDSVVMELSSFQLEIMTISPQVAAILNITPNHLDRHGSMENYVAAKANIIRHQGPGCMSVLNYDDAITRQLEDFVPGELTWFSSRQIVPDGAFMTGSRLVLAGNTSFDYVPHVLLDKADIPLRGQHNVMNVLAACAIAGSIGLAFDRPGIEAETMRETIRHFEPVPHRLETVRELDGVTYVNDSIATAPERLVAALRSFEERVVLLLGGADKDLPWEEAVLLALDRSRHIVVFGQGPEHDGDDDTEPSRSVKLVRDKVLPLLRRLAPPERVSVVKDLGEAVQRARGIAEAGDVVLLSPGGTSYDAYPDFAARGVHFRELVARLG